MKRETQRIKRATLSEVAKQAGVSATTASLVLGGKAAKHRIAEETLQRVMAAAKELDYSPNMLVHSLQRGHTNVISFFNAFRNRHIDDLYMDRLSTALEHAAGQMGYDLLIHCDFSRTAEETYEQLNGGRADGVLLFAPSADDPLLPLLRRSRLPVVLINARDPEALLPSVQDDVAAGLGLVAEALVEHGHRRIGAVVEVGPEFRDGWARIHVLREQLARRGVDLPDENVLEIPQGGHRQVLSLLQRADRPTALFCWRDWLAYRCLELCEEIGLEAPRDVSVTGYDGLHWPAITRHIAASVAVDLRATARSAVELLDEYVRGERTAPVEVRTPVTFDLGTTLSAAPH